MLQAYIDAGVPQGVVNLVMGPGETVGQALQDHPGIDGIVFTGSYAVGMQLFHAFSKAWPRPTIVEMGGKNPAIVTRHADLDEAAEGIMRSAFGFGGQKCSACSRVIGVGRVYPRLVERLSTLPEVTDVASDLQDQGLQAYVEIDRDSAGRLGVTPAAIDNVLYNAYGQRLVSTIFTQSNQYRVVLEVKPEFRQGPLAISELYVASNTGVQVPLGSMVRVVEKPVALSINHIGQFPAATVSFNLARGASLGEAVRAVEQAERDIGMPISVRTSFQGAALAFRASLTSTLWLIVAAVVTMYIVLGVLYESYIHPVTILSTLPSAGIGALLALLIARQDLGVMGVIGIILLIGIVKKNAIMMIDFALDAERREGKSPREAIKQASLLRFRPIVMTTLSALLGALPLMLGTGVGSELRHPLGITMVGGLILSQLITLFTTPVIYLWFDRLARRVRQPGAQPA